MTRTHSGLAIAAAVLALSVVGGTPTAAQTVTPTPIATASPSPTAAPAPADATPSDPAPTPAAPAISIAPDNDVRDQEHEEDRGADNIVDVQNFSDNQFRMRGSVDLDHINGDTATPTNRAQAYSSCTGCETFAVALQIVLIRNDATTVAPVNQAISVNNGCTSCYTSARALQYVIMVDDPSQTPFRARLFVAAMNFELRAIARARNTTPQQANARIDAVIAQFNDLAANMKDQRQDSDQPDQDNDSGPA